MHARFGDFPDDFATEQGWIYILPVPYDGTSTWRRGSSLGPAAVLEASHHLENYDIESDFEVYRLGIYTDSAVEENSSPGKMVAAVRERVQAHLANDKYVVTLGGEHTVSIGAVQAHVERFGDLAVLQLDAHADLRPQYQGSTYNHACVMARVREVAPVVQVGIRSMDKSEKAFIRSENIFYAHEICQDTGWFAKVISRLPTHVYLTLDVDVLDPSIMPSTGTPEPGGLLWYDLLAFLQTLTRQRNLVGFDVTELCPDKSNPAPDYLVARLIHKLLSYRFCGWGKK